MMMRWSLGISLLFVASAGSVFAQGYVTYSGDPAATFVGDGRSVHYRRGPAVSVPRSPGAVTWYNVGNGYSSAPQTGLPWQRRSAPPNRPWTTETPTAPNLVARSSRVPGREYHARVVNGPIREADVPKTNRFEEELATVGDKTVTAGTKMKPRNVPKRLQPPSSRPVPAPRPIQPVGTQRPAGNTKTSAPSR